MLKSPLDCKEILPVNPKGNQPWIFIGRTEPLATWFEELTPWKRPWCWESLKAGEEGDDREWDGWMASLTQWTWVWASSRSCWWTGKTGVLQSMGLQRVRHDWANELNWFQETQLSFVSFSLQVTTHHFSLASFKILFSFFFYMGFLQMILFVSHTASWVCRFVCVNKFGKFLVVTSSFALSTPLRLLFFWYPNDRKGFLRRRSSKESACQC